MKDREIVVENTNSIYRYISNLSFASQGCLSIYWDICEKYGTRALVDARTLINVPIGSKAFRAEESLNYQSNKPEERKRRWNWVQLILLRLERIGFVRIKPIGNNPPFSIKSLAPIDANYILDPRVSKLVFHFPAYGEKTEISSIIAAHKFIGRFIPPSWPPPYSQIREHALNSICKTKGQVAILFPR